MPSDIDFGPNKSAVYNIEAEEALLGCVLINPDCLEELDADYKADYFYLHKHRWAWQAFTSLREKNLPIDYLTLSSYLEDRKQLAEFGGTSYLTHLINSVPTSLHAEAYSKLIERDWMRREILSYATGLAKIAYAESNDLETEINRYVASLEGLITSRSGQMIPLAEAVRRLHDHIQAVELEPDKYRAMSTGLVDLNTMMGGGIFQRQLTLFTGDPGVGKTKLMLQIAKALAEDGHPGAIFELEMSLLQTTSRMVSAESGIKTLALQYGPMRDEDYAVLVEAMDILSRLPIEINTNTRCTTLEFQARCRQLKRDKGIKWAMFDFFDLFADELVGGDSNLRDVVMVRRLTSTALDNDLAVIGTHTLTKAGMVEKEKKMGHLSGNSKIIYAANNAFNVTEHIPEPGFPSDPEKVTIMPLKMRETEKDGSCDLQKKKGFPCFQSIYSGAEEPPTYQGRPELF